MRSDDGDEADDDDDAGDDGPDQAPRATRAPGCLIKLAIFGIAALAGGIYFLNQWNTLAGPAKAAAIMLVVFGSLALLPPLLMLGLRIFVKLAMRKLGKEFAGAADQIMNLSKGMYSQVHEFRPAEEDDFDELDRSYYDGMVDALEPLGFRHLGDIVDETIEQLQGVAVPIRVLASADGSTQVGAYHFKLAGQEKMICDVSSEFSDGTFLMTSNTEGADEMTPPPQLQRRHHPQGTPPLELIRLHEIDKQKLLAARPGATAVRVSTLADAIESEKRQQQAKNAFRKDIGFVDPEEVKRIADQSDAGEFSDQIADAADQRRRREQS